jgi:hypothetical protein
MTAVHADCLGNEAHNKGEHGRTIRTRCFDAAACSWVRPLENPTALRLPCPFPSRFKNILGDQSKASLSHPRCPSLLCTGCGCGECISESGEQVAAGLRWQDCRRSSCDNCGFSNKFPVCPTLMAARERIPCRVLGSQQNRVLWIDGGKAGPEPPVKIRGKVDSLVEVVVGFDTFMSYLSVREDGLVGATFLC